MKKKARGTADAAANRTRELEETIARLETERGADRVELTVADATIDAARSRILALERACEHLTERIAMAERERDARPVERQLVVVPDEDVLAERDRLHRELREARETRADLELAVADLGDRIASLTEARERLFEGSLRSADERVRLERLVADRTREIERLEAQHLELHAVLANDRAESAEAIARLESRCAKLEYERDGEQSRFTAMKADFDRFKARSRERADALKHAEASLATSAETVRSLALAHRQATESLASLELTCMRLEYDIASRVGAAEANASRAGLSAQRLREERTLLLETIALRERRIAVLEGTLREIAHDMLRTAEAERARYLALHHTLLSSKIVTIRDAVRALFFKAVARRARKRRTPRDGRKRPRHLRSA